MTWLTLALVAITGYYAWKTAQILKAQQAGVTYEVLYRALTEYRSVDMLLAISTLHDFRRQHGEEFVKAYLRIKAEQDKAIGQAVTASDRLDRVRYSLHHQRRLVSQYYQMLAGFRELQVVPDQVLYAHFGPDELAIITDIILPIENAIAGSEHSAAFDRGQKRLTDLAGGYK